MGFIKSEERDFFEIWHRIKKRDFSGNAGTAIKNSIFQTSTTLIGKIGSLIFTIIIARLLMPELFGLYNLALSTVLIFAALSNLGLGETFVTFVSREMGKHNLGKAKAYAVYLSKLKMIFVTIAVAILLITAKFISENYYQKPLFLAIIAGALYLLFFELVNLFSMIFQASNSFKGLFYKEIVFQTGRVLLAPIAVILSLRYSLSNEGLLFYLILALGLAYLFTTIFMIFVLKKEKGFLKTEAKKLSKKEMKNIHSFLAVTAVFVLSGMFFSYIDKIIMGPFVSAEYIGYYAAALTLVSSLSALIGFGVVLLPLFSRLSGKKLEKGLRKSLRIVLALGTVLFLGVLLTAPLAIWIIYGSAYMQATNILRLFSILLVIVPLIGVYSVYFISINKPRVVAEMLVISTIVNILLTYLFVKMFLPHGDLATVIGAGIAGVLSQIVYLGGLIYKKK